MDVKMFDPKDELPVVLDKLRYARQLSPGHDDSLRNRQGKRIIHIDCDVCIHNSRLDYLLEMFSHSLRVS